MTVDLSKRNTPSRLLRSPVDTDHIGERSEYLDIVNTSKREKLDLEFLGQISGATSPNTAKSGAGDPLFASIQRAKQIIQEEDRTKSGLSKLPVNRRKSHEQLAQVLYKHKKNKNTKVRETPIGFKEFTVEVHSLESPVQNSSKKPNHDPLPDYVNTEERREIEEFMQEELNLFEPKEDQDASYVTLLEQVSIDSKK